MSLVKKTGQSIWMDEVVQKKPLVNTGEPQTMKVRETVKAEGEMG
jgi:hypothetical protein